MKSNARTDVAPLEFCQMFGNPTRTIVQSPVRQHHDSEIASIAVVERLERTAGLASAVLWLRKAHVTEQFGVEKRTRKLRSFFSRWSIKFSADYYEAKERQASGVPLSDDTHARLESPLFEVERTRPAPGAYSTAMSP